MKPAPERVLAGRRAVAYLRESTEEQGRGVAPEVQRAAARKFASENGITIIREYLDLHSACGEKSMARPEFARMLRDAADGGFDFIGGLVWSSQ